MRRAPQGVLSAFAFNLCLFVLPIAAAMAVMVIGRDHLYAYEYSPQGARAVSARVEQLNGQIIQIEFDRQRQWNDLVALELRAGDVHAARGFVLSGAGMLPQRMGQALDRIAPDGDATVELAAVDLLTPSTRQRYEQMIPLLSQQGNGAALTRLPAEQVTVGDQSDFELMARALLTQPEGDALQFILTGMSLGLAGNASQREIVGAAALLAASRREDYPREFGAEMSALLNQAVSMERFRSVALAAAEGDNAGAYANAAAAFRVAVNREKADQARAALEEIGAAGQLISVSGATNLVTHAQNIRDLPRLRLLAQAAGDRAAAAAKRLPRDGRLIRAAHGELSLTRDLALAVAAMAIAFLGLLGVLGFKAYQGVRRAFSGVRDEDDYAGELVEIGASNWRPL